MMRSTFGLLVAACVGAAGVDAVAQSTSSSIAPFRSAVEAVTVDVGVYDQDGKPVPGLSPGDFVVSVAGQVRRVVSASFVDPGAGKLVATGEAPAGSIPIPVSTNDHVGVGRLVVFVVDQGTLDQVEIRNVTVSASKFFQHLTPADRSALVLMPVGMGLPFTSDHERVRLGLNKAAGLSTRMLESHSLGLEEVRAIANGDFAALQSAARRECPSQDGGLLARGGTGGGQGAGGGGGGQGGGQGGTGSGSGGAVAPPNDAALGFGSDDPCTRRLQFDAQSTWHQLHSGAMASMTALRGVLGELKKIPGEKTVILLSGGWPLELREASSELSPISAAAADARATIFTLFAASADNSAEQRTISSTPMQDLNVRRWPLQTLASMTGGNSFRVDVGAESVFDRLGRELSGYYRLGVEQDPRDRDARPRPMSVQVNRRGVTTRAPERFVAVSYADRDLPARLESALSAPLPATGLGMRLASYVASDAGATGKAKVVLVGEAYSIAPGDVTLQLAVRDLQGKLVASAPQQLPSAESERVSFTTSVDLAPGRYIVRAAVMDDAGSVGSVDHVLDVRRTTVGALTAGDLGLGRVPEDPGAQPGYLVDAIEPHDRLALQLDLEGEADRIATADVLFELAASPEGPALASVEATRSSGSGGGIAQAVASLDMLPPGVYMARARVTDGTASAVVVRPFIISGGLSTSVAAGGASDAGLRIALPPPRFAMDQVLAPSILGVFLDRLAARPDARASSLAPVIDRLRKTPAAEVTVPEALAAESPVAAGFVTGLSRLARAELNPAAEAFRASLRASSDFYPAMIYLGACFAAAGKDVEAAGAWQTALIKEGGVPELHGLLIDALLRLRRYDEASAAVGRARRRWPDDPAFARRGVTVALSAGRHADAMAALDAMQFTAADEPVLLLGLRVLYQAIAHAHPVENLEADRTRLLRYAEAYRGLAGPSAALVDTWVAAVSPERVK